MKVRKGRRSKEVGRRREALEGSLEVAMVTLQINCSECVTYLDPRCHQLRQCHHALPVLHHPRHLPLRDSRCPVAPQVLLDGVQRRLHRVCHHPLLRLLWSL